MAKLAVHQTGQTAAYGSKDTSTEAPLGLSEESAEPSVVSLQSSFNKYGARRPLPAALTFSRTLSVVPDVPSPIRTPTASSIGSGENTRPSTSNGIQQNLRPARDASADTIRPRSSASDASTRHWAPFVARQQRLNSNASVPSTSLDMADPIPLLTRPIKPPPRRRSSFAAAQHEEPLSANPVEPLPQGTDSFDHAIRAREVHRKLLDAPRSQSALGTIRSLSPTTQLQQTRQTPAAYKRASMYTLGLSSSRSSMDVGHSRLDGHFLEDARGEPMAKLEPLGLRASASNVHLRSHSASSTKSHLNRRSMSHLADGPPPMPPPTCALPPLPPMGTGRRPRPM